MAVTAASSTDDDPSSSALTNRGRAAMSPSRPRRSTAHTRASSDAWEHEGRVGCRWSRESLIAHGGICPRAWAATTGCAARNGAWYGRQVLLRRVELRDFRSQQEASLDLVGPDGKPVRVTALIGPNGSGKTAWLDAVAGFFSELLPEYGGPRLDPSDVRDGATSAGVRVMWSEGESAHEGALTVRRLDLGETSPRAAGKARRKAITGDARFDAERDRWADEDVSASSRVIVYLDTRRYFDRRNAVIGPNRSSVAKRHPDGSLGRSTSQFSLLTDSRVDQLRQWIVNVEFQRARAMADRGEALPLWGHLVSVLNRLLSPCRFERVSEDFEVLFRTPSGVVPIERLSSGYQSVLVIATELLLRLSFAIDDTARMFDVDAVCLVDEIDAHLHPLWQTRILDDLRWAFPRVQFIVTTHSEHIVAGLQPFEISVLQESAP